MRNQLFYICMFAAKAVLFNDGRDDSDGADVVPYLLVTKLVDGKHFWNGRKSVEYFLLSI